MQAKNLRIRLMAILRVNLLCFLLIVVCSCNENSEIGVDFFEDGDLEVLYTDSLTLKVSTVTFDSLITSTPVRLLVGNHADSKLGTLTAKSFFQLTPEQTYSLDKDKTSYGRTVLKLTYDAYSYYDTLMSNTFSVHPVTETILLDEGYLYNNQSFAYSTTALGTVTFTPTPNRSDTLDIPLLDSFGQELFELIKTEADQVSTSEKFLAYLKGLVIVPSGGQNGAIIGFSSAQLVIYYSDNTTVPSTEDRLSFSIGSNISFNQVITDRSTTLLHELSTRSAGIESSKTDNTAYIQGGAGLGLRVEIPYVKDLLLRNSNIIISYAQLEMVPVQGSYNSNTALPATLGGYEVNLRNDFLTTTTTVSAQLYEDIDIGRNTRYAADVSTYIRQQLKNTQTSGNALLFVPVDNELRFSVTRACIGDQTSYYKMKLKIYYVDAKD